MKSWLVKLSPAILVLTLFTPGCGSNDSSNEGNQWVVLEVVDGDTIRVSNEQGQIERVRLIGIDAPEEGACGFSEATQAIALLLKNKRVSLVSGASSDRDRYSRLLRYVEADGVDIGLQLVRDGLAIARYDSRDGYGAHAREEKYVASDLESLNICR